MSNYCPKCGSKTYQDSLFCDNCGSQLTLSKMSSENVDIQESNFQQRPDFTNRTRTPRYSSNAEPIPATSTYPYRKKPHKHLGLIIGIIIIGVIGISALSALFIGFVPLLEITDSYEYVGSHDYRIEGPANFTEIEVFIDNSIGSVNIYFEEHMSDMINAQLHVYAKSNHDLYGSEVADVGQNSNSQVYFLFTTNLEWKNPYTYDIDLYISNKLASKLFIEVSTGAIMVDARKTLIEELFLETSTGSIDARFVDVRFNNSISNNYMIDTSTGSVNTQFDNVTYTDETNDPNWVISTSTGSVNIELSQEQALNTSLSIDYDVSTSTGSVTCIFALNNSIGYYLDASTSLGEIEIESYETTVSLPYYSENYQNASLKYNIELRTSTGSIEIYQEPYSDIQ